MNLEYLEEERLRDWDEIEEQDADRDYEPPTCGMCGGLLMPLGQLGRRMHYRCRNCGMDCSREES